MKDLDKALTLIAAHSGRADFAGPQQAARVAQAEAVLGVQFPPSYRQFLLELGCGGFRGREFYGVASGDRLDVESPVPSTVGVTLRARTRFKLPTELVIVYASGYGPRFAIDTSVRDSSGECPILEWRHFSEPRCEIASSFGTMFRQLVEEALEEGE